MTHDQLVASLRLLTSRVTKLELLLGRDDSADLKAWMEQEDAKMAAAGKMPPELPTVDDLKRGLK